MNDYLAHDAVGLAELVRKREADPAELLEAALKRAREVNPKINAIVLDHEPEARSAIAAGLPDGPFRGVPFLLKDLNAGMAGTVTTQGSRFFKDALADHDSTLVARYKAAGLVIFGKTNTPEFGATCSTEPVLFGPTRNPWNLDHSSGGSSGGAAAAVAAGIVPAAHASDGGGSIRIPASACGLFGFKPSRGRTPQGPDRGEGWAGLSISHVVSRTVRDSAALLDATDGPEPGDPYAAPAKEYPYTDEIRRVPGRLRIAMMTKSPSGTRVDPECAAAVAATAKTLESLGHVVEEAYPSYDVEALRRAQTTIVAASTAAVLAERGRALGREATKDDVEAINLMTAELGRRSTAVDYLNAITTIHRAGRSVGRFFEKYDVLLTPTMGSLPPPIGRLNLMREDIAGYIEDLVPAIAFTTLGNQTGCPAASLPLVWSNSGLPIGVMAMGALGADGLIFRLAASLEEAMPWKDRRAPI